MDRDYLKSNRGYTLVGILSSIGILGIFMLFVNSYYANETKSQKSNNAKLDTVTSVSFAMSAIKDKFGIASSEIRLKDGCENKKLGCITTTKIEQLEKPKAGLYFAERKVELGFICLDVAKFIKKHNELGQEIYTGIRKSMEKHCLNVTGCSGSSFPVAVIEDETEDGFDKKTYPRNPSDEPKFNSILASAICPASDVIRGETKINILGYYVRHVGTTIRLQEVKQSVLIPQYNKSGSLNILQ